MWCIHTNIDIMLLRLDMLKLNVTILVLLRILLLPLLEMLSLVVLLLGRKNEMVFKGSTGSHSVKGKWD
jgi:hypothetical protein